ncbi:hypothetical protein SAMN05216187_109101 [Jeotgalicoccus aerolatus]|uniref:Cytokinin riboside 5'-monophosphate phosphoribohydrolase n=1 Tax=Jeotgalicoccus aerolatus TaxID=709510 RepID=A0A1G9CFQ2_9STAP|nr:TIGR00730 family Rossman fold protein [Jeotgalicoccus aerolatus]NMA80478.1 TIGR00730 family Rossman fold protein [Jeotgalicoccus aerolatus]SDK50255.1 hypothetical protein SAMN05216187_109101 [Jeotgalicoccus aerolatus]
MDVKKITVFCGAKTGKNENYEKAAFKLGRDAAKRNITIVYGGGATGLMGAVANGALSEQGHVTGVIPQFLVDREVAHPGVKDMRIVQSMHQRKLELENEGDAVIMMPGGAGTLEEFFEVFTWGQLGLHEKPIGILNVDGYFDALKTVIDKSIEEGFLEERYLDMLFIHDNLADIVTGFENYVPVAARTNADLK